MEKNKYKELVDKYTPKEDILYNSIVAFITGGIMGIIGQFLIDFYATIFMLSTLIF